MNQHSRRHVRRQTQVLVVSAAAALALTACAAGSGDADDGDAGPVTISVAVQTQTNESKPYSTTIDAFQAENPDVEVEVVEIPNDQFAATIKTQLQAGNAPDVIFGSPGTGNPNSLGLLAETGNLLDLSDEDWAVDSVPPSAEALYNDADGVQFGLPLDVAPIPMTVNWTVFEATGLEIATTFDDLLDQCTTARDAGLASLIALSGSTPPNTGIMALELAATRVYSATPDWNEQRAAGEVTFADSVGWVQTLEDIIAMNEQGCFQDGAEGGTFDTLAQYVSGGQSIAAFAPAGFAADMKSFAPDADFTVIAFPGESADDGFVFASPSNAFGINAATEHPEAAKQFLEYFAQPETQDAFAELTGNASLAAVLSGAELPERFEHIADYIQNPDQNAPLANLFWPNGEVYNQLGVGVQGLITGQATPAQVLEAMDAAYDS